MSNQYELHYKDSSTVKLLTKREMIKRLSQIYDLPHAALKMLDEGKVIDATFVSYRKAGSK